MNQERNWRPIHWEECTRCGYSQVETFTTTQTPDEYINDGDPAVCPRCGQNGICSVDGEGEASIGWEDQNF
jgi:hypothetical protein